MSIENIVIGTRGSKLALWQTNWVRDRIRKLHPEIGVEVRVISTKGDRIQNVSLPKLGEEGKGLFTKELEDAMLDRQIDLAVHSLKDLPTELPEGLHIGAISEREDVRDALVARSGISSFDDIPEGARIGTSSLRRQAQILAARRDLILDPVRGNVDTRLGKVDSGEYDAIILASAGLRRLGHEDRITQYISQEFMLPAVGQGALAIETRSDDPAINRIIHELEHEPTKLACRAERALLKGLGGGCLVPIAALGIAGDRTLSLRGLVARPDGSEIVRGEGEGPVGDAEEIGYRLAEELLRRGADRVLDY
ncbi:MAG TPA: hydroxymethylbilane synthase [Blastocatellia bacterium]|jgi:hydroxymethylbilane synthase|nr:hydroxymethylbilane synthase [Blastocatellia bacterium]